jgi:hypothetical protein
LFNLLVEILQRSDAALLTEMQDSFKFFENSLNSIDNFIEQHEPNYSSNRNPGMSEIHDGIKKILAELRQNRFEFSESPNSSNFNQVEHETQCRDEFLQKTLILLLKRILKRFLPFLLLEGISVLVTLDRNQITMSILNLEFMSEILSKLLTKFLN